MKTNMVKLERSSTELTTTDLDNGVEFSLCQRPFTDVVIDHVGAAELIGTLWQKLAGRLGGEAARALVDAEVPLQEVSNDEGGGSGVDEPGSAGGRRQPSPVDDARRPDGTGPWEVVDEANEPDEVTLRLSVPGGWLYRVDVAGFSSMAFVPGDAGATGAAADPGGR